MLQRRPTASRIVEYGMPEERVDIPSSRPEARASSPNLLLTLWRRRWIVLSCIVVAVGAAIFYLSQATKIYSSSSQIYIQQSMPRIMGEQMSGGMNLLNYLQTQCDVIRSTAVVRDALNEPITKQATSLQTSEDPVDLIKYSLSTTVGKQSDIITVSAESPYAEDAAVFANSVVSAYIKYENKLHRSTAADIVNALQKEKERQDDEFKQISNEMLQFKQNNGQISFDSGDKGNVILQRLAELSQAMTNAEIDSMQARVASESADAFSANPAKLQQLMANSRLPGTEGGSSIRGEIHQYEMQIMDLRNTYGAGYPPAAALEKRLERLRAQAADADAAAAANFLALVHQQAAAAQKRVDELQNAFNVQQKLALELNAKAAQYSQLQMTLTRTEKVLDFLDSRIKEFRVTQDNDEPNSISVLETARPESTPVRPNRIQVLAIALALGAMAGMGAALLLDWMDHRIRSISEVEALLGLPILGAVPHMLGKRTPMERGQEIHMFPKSEVAEAYRTIRTGIRFGLSDAASRTLLVTSPSPGDGKTTVASNLAIAIAQTGKRVLLVDADCRRPMVHRIYGIEAEVGISGVLSGQVDLAAAIHKSSTENLDILPCGALPPNPAEMLNSEGFTSLLHDLANRYDQVVVDSPPVAPVTDARILAAACDATILVVRAEKTSRRVAEHARDALVSVGGNLLGVVINDAPRSRTEGSSYGHYHYGYGSKSTIGKSRSKEIKAISVSTPS
jgi:succinoglycan biosynthesis transport protein ExoP